MNDYQKKYIELKNQYENTKGSFDSVAALYDFKYELENSDFSEAKIILVDIYDLLNFKKDAYELLLKIGNNSERKVLKKLGMLKDYAEKWGNYYAIPKPKTAEERKIEIEKLEKFPYFRYHPNPLETGAFQESEEGVVCDCCQKTTYIFYGSPFYSIDEISYLCPNCIANGEAAKKFDGEFQDEFSLEEGVDSFDRVDELIHRTPGYHGCQQEFWRSHCGDFCAFIGYVGARELRALGVMEEVLDDQLWDSEQKEIIQKMINGGSVQGYLFQCLHCGKHLLWIDYD